MSPVLAPSAPSAPAKTGSSAQSASLVGVHAGWSFDRYKALRVLNHSTLRNIDRSPRHMQWTLEHGDDGETAAKSLGTAFHMLCLEPAEFARLVIAPPINPTTKKPYADMNCKAMVEFRQANPGRIVMSDEQIEDLHSMVSAFMANPDAAACMRAHGTSEETMVWQCPYTGLLCKGRVDRRVAGVARYDLKTTADASVNAFRGSIKDYGYHTQAAFYEIGARELGLTETAHIIIAVESARPFDVVVYELDAEYMRIGRILVREWLQRAAACVKSGQWPGVQQHPGAMAIGPPMWLLSQFQSAE